MKVGITERGDAGLDLSWQGRLREVDGVILVTKNLTRPEFVEALKNCNIPFVLHCTCTGMGGTEWEPNVPPCRDQLAALRSLVDEGIVSRRNVVIRIDPINPYAISFFSDVMDVMRSLFPDYSAFRYRISVMDYYRHVRHRLSALKLPYPNGFTASPEDFRKISEELKKYPDILFETCAEPSLRGQNIIHTGCVGWEDVRLMGIDENGIREAVNPQNRQGCLCLTCKTELLSARRPCAHKCAYCYWRD